jgi:hypothetical protein
LTTEGSAAEILGGWVTSSRTPSRVHLASRVGPLDSTTMAENPLSIASSGRWRGLHGGRLDRLYVGAHVVDQQH